MRSQCPPPKSKSQKIQDRWEKHFNSREFVEFVSQLPCEKCGQVYRYGNHVHHEPPKGRGGTWETVVALCPDCHVFGPGARHTVGPVTFWPKGYEEATARTHAAWLAHIDAQ